MVEQQKLTPQQAQQAKMNIAYSTVQRQITSGTYPPRDRPGWGRAEERNVQQIQHNVNRVLKEPQAPVGKQLNTPAGGYVPRTVKELAPGADVPQARGASERVQARQASILPGVSKGQLVSSASQKPTTKVVNTPTGGYVPIQWKPPLTGIQRDSAAYGGFNNQGFVMSTSGGPVGPNLNPPKATGVGSPVVAVPRVIVVPAPAFKPTYSAPAPVIKIIPQAVVVRKIMKY